MKRKDLSASDIARRIIARKSRINLSQKSTSLIEEKMERIRIDEIIKAISEDAIFKIV